MSEDRAVDRYAVFDREAGEVVERTAMGGEMRPLASRETMEVMTALHKAQGAMESPKRTKTATVTSRDPSKRSYTYTYAPLEEVYRVIKQPFADNGLCRQEYMVSRGGMWFVRTIVWHTSGQWISGDFPVFADMTANNFKAGVTTARRLGTSMLCGLAPEDDGDDANQSEAKPAVAGNGTDRAVVEIDHPDRPLRKLPIATRASPAVASQDNDEQRVQRIAAKQIKYAIDATKSVDELREIYDDVLAEWGEGYRDDAALLNTVTLNFLISHVRSRLQQIGDAG